MTKPEDLDWLFGLQLLGVTPGLERIRRLLRSLGNPQEAFRCLLVGGTNGKGSCARALAECLAAAGERPGLFTSPHLSRLGERFVVGGVEAEREALEESLAHLRPAVDEVGATFFEAVTALACLHFARSGVSTAVMEVGLGGRFDATNALEPEASIITGIALDHTALLGSSEREIAFEKAGILRSGRLGLTGASGEGLESLRAVARDERIPLWTLDQEIHVEGELLGWRGVRLSVSAPVGAAGGESPLVGGHQIRNLALAVAAALSLGVGQEAVERGLASTRWPGRLERFSYRDRWVVFDGAHNPAAAGALSRALVQLGVNNHTLLAGLGRDKDLEGVANELVRGAATVLATSASKSPRARKAQEVADAFMRAAGRGQGHDESVEWGSSDAAEGPPQVFAVHGAEAAFEEAVRRTRPGGTVVVAGSLYLVGELRPLVTGEETERFERWQ